MSQFQFRHPPLDFQLEVLQQSCDLAAYALFWDMGLGKTKQFIDQAVYWYNCGKIDGVLVVAPNGIHSNWDVPGEGLQKHLPVELLEKSYRLVWHSKRAKHASTKHQLRKLYESPFPWLIMAYDAFITKDGARVADEFLTQRRVAFCLDECTRVKNSAAQRTKVLKKLRLKSRYRRILTGTPAEQSPFDVYSQIDWLIPGYWREQGIGSHIAFKHHFADWRKMRAPAGHEFEVQLKDQNGRPIFKNLDQLQAMLAPISSRLLKTDKLQLPDKVYQRVYYELEPGQRKLYDQMESDYAIWFEKHEGALEEYNRLLETHGDDSAEVMDFLSSPNSGLGTSAADISVVRQLRLHQLAMGYVTDDVGNIVEVAKPNPALELLSELIEDLPHSAIIWCRFKRDVALVAELLGDRAVRYEGATSAEDRVKGVADFQAERKQFFIGTDAAAEGLTLTAAKTVIYYSNGRKLGKRRQSEDRAMRIGQTSSVHYLDMLARRTISEDILDGLLFGEEISAKALGDRIKRKWINS